MIYEITTNDKVVQARIDSYSVMVRYRPRYGPDSLHGNNKFCDWYKSWISPAMAREFVQGDWKEIEVEE